VLYHGIALGLAETEFLLLEALLESPRVILPRDRLVHRVFQRTFRPLDRSLDMLVSRLRRKLQIVDKPGALIRTIRSSGYLLAAREQS
jgi:two-component system OmpR family response regulator